MTVKELIDLLNGATDPDDVVYLHETPENGGTRFTGIWTFSFSKVVVLRDGREPR